MQPAFTLEELTKLVGQDFLVRDGEMEVFYPVRVIAIETDHCALKAVVSPLAGIGEQRVCCGDLLTLAQANQAIEEDTQREMADQAYNRITNCNYLKERRARFLLMVDVECNDDEKACLQEEAGGSLLKVSDGFIRKHAERILYRKYKVIEREDG